MPFVVAYRRRGRRRFPTGSSPTAQPASAASARHSVPEAAQQPGATLFEAQSEPPGAQIISEVIDETIIFLSTSASRVASPLSRLVACSFMVPEMVIIVAINGPYLS